jgi:hypothetical protein
MIIKGRYFTYLLQADLPALPAARQAEDREVTEIFNITNSLLSSKKGQFLFPELPLFIYSCMPALGRKRILNYFLGAFTWH